MLIAWALWLSSFGHGATPVGSKERLRRLARLPRLSFTVGMAFDPLRGFSMLSDRATALREIAELRKALQGNASDAPRYARMGRWYGDLGEEKQARTALTKAVDLYREQGADQSDDGVLLADFGTALSALGNAEEAERILRRAVRASPKEWKCAAALGRFLGQQALVALTAKDNPPGESAAPNASPLKVAPAQAEKAQKLGQEALECYDRAVELGPKEPEPYAGRATARSLQRLLQAMLDGGSGSEPESLRLAKALYPKESLSDLRMAMSLSPKDPKAVGTAVMFELLLAAVDRGATHLEAFAEGEGWDSLPDATRQSLRESMARLEEMSQTGEAGPAAAALEMLGTLQCFVVRDVRGAESSLRRAVDLDPKRNQAWESLVYLLASNKRSEDLLVVCEARLKTEESAHARLLLAKAYEQLERWDRLLDTAETLQRRYPEDFNANLALAAALLRRPPDDAALSRSAHAIAKAEKLLGTSPTADQVVNLLVLRGVLLGLAGQTEAARSSFKQLLEIEKDNADAREALEILEQG